MFYTQQEVYDIANRLYAENNYNPIKMRDIAKECKMDIAAFRKMRYKYGYNDDFPDVTRVLIKKIHAFDTLTSKSAYWLGYIAADGCITEVCGSSKVNRLMLECAEEDGEILHKFCDFLRIRHSRISRGHHNTSLCLCLCEGRFSTFVSNYNITKQKSYKENNICKEIIDNDELFFSFLKGYIDGDGTIHTYKGSPGISMVGDFTFLNEIKLKLSETLPYPKHLWMNDVTKDPEKSARSLWQLKIGTSRFKYSNTKFLYEKMYADNYIVLTRKYEKLKLII